MYNTQTSRDIWLHNNFIVSVMRWREVPGRRWTYPTNWHCARMLFCICVQKRKRRTCWNSPYQRLIREVLKRGKRNYWLKRKYDQNISFDCLSLLCSGVNDDTPLARPTEIPLTQVQHGRNWREEKEATGWTKIYKTKHLAANICLSCSLICIHDDTQITSL